MGSRTKKAARHSRSLEELVNRHLPKVGESPEDIVWRFTEGVWTPDINQEKFCDLVLVYPNCTSLIELKSSEYHRDKAIQQLDSSEYWALKELGKDVASKKIVYYERDFDFELIPNIYKRIETASGASICRPMVTMTNYGRGNR